MVSVSKWAALSNSAPAKSDGGAGRQEQSDRAEAEEADYAAGGSGTSRAPVFESDRQSDGSSWQGGHASA